MKPTKTDAALAMVDAGATPYAAAKAQGVSTSAVYRAMRRREERNLCPCCGQVVREGFEVVKMPEPEALALRPAMAGVRAAVKSRDAVTRSVIERELRALLAQLEGGK